MSKRRIRAYILLLTATAIWAAASPIIKFTLREISPLNFLTYRFLISGVIGIVFLILMKPKIPNNKKAYFYLFSYSIFTMIALTMLFMGLDQSRVLDLVVVDVLGPLVTALAGAIFLKERITRREKTGLAIAFSGTLIAIAIPYLINKGFEASRFSGNIMLILFMILDTGSYILAKEAVRNKIGPATLVNVTFIILFLFFVPLNYFIKGGEFFLHESLNLSVYGHLGVAYMAILSGTVAYTLWAAGQKTIEVSEASLFRYLYPTFSAPLAVIWLREEINGYFLVGAVLILIGVILAEYKKHKKQSI